jgi:hypothetical protein
MGTPVSAGAGVRKPVRPAPNRSVGLWSRCLYACAAGWNKGWSDNDGATTFEDQTKMKGVLQGSRGSTHVIIDAGRALDAGSSVNNINWNAPLSRYNLSLGFSAAALVRPDSTTAPASDLAIFSKRNSTDNTSGGWHLGIEDGSNTFEVEISDGVSGSRANSLIAPETTRSRLIVATYDRSNLRIYIDGILRATEATSLTVGNNSEPIRLFGFAGNVGVFDGSASVAVLWNRPLSQGEISKLWSDPYIMWKTELHKEFMFGLAGGGARFQTFFLNFG